MRAPPAGSCSRSRAPTPSAAGTDRQLELRSRQFGTKIKLCALLVHVDVGRLSTADSVAVTCGWHDHEKPPPPPPPGPSPEELEARAAAQAEAARLRLEEMLSAEAEEQSVDRRREAAAAEAARRKAEDAEEAAEAAEAAEAEAARERVVAMRFAQGVAAKKRADEEARRAIEAARAAAARPPTPAASPRSRKWSVRINTVRLTTR